MKLLAVVVLVAAVGFVEPHGYLKSPLARTSIQLDPSFGTQQPYWWDNQGVWCANVQQDVNYSSCGRCGEAAGNRDASQGGMYDKGVITRSYTSGSQIQVTANFQAPHHGCFEVELCASETETDGCFQKLPVLSSTDGVKDGRACVPYDNVNKDITATVQLPSGVRCSRCTLRWTYRTSYPGTPNWDSCWNPNPTQTFRNCADIAIN